MDIPAIGRARGVFEILIPGVFLLINLGIAIYFLPIINTQTRKYIKDIVFNPLTCFLVLILLGYLLGLILRLFRAEMLDSFSGKVNSIFPKHRNKKYITEKFPYFEWLEELCEKYLPNETSVFFKRTWGLRKIQETRKRKKVKKRGNKQYFNFCKTLINAVDERSAAEIYAAEVLTRYISGTFYALVFSSLSLLSTAIFTYSLKRKVMWEFCPILIIYLVAILCILKNYRFTRLKEVETVFAASFKLRDKIEI